MSLNSRFLNLLMSRPAQEKIRSDGTEVADTHSTFLATCAIIGKRCSFCCHHTKGTTSDLLFSTM